MEIKDLAGLSEPLTKLIEVLSQGIGGWAKPWQIKRIADAKVYEIERVSQALEKHSDSLNLAEYNGEKVKLLCEQQDIPPEATQELIEMRERTASRLMHNEMRRQRNIEQTIRHTAEELSQKEKVSDDPVDEDWITRFFNIAEDVSNEQMQQLWGRILAGEIKKPKTYSLRTLEALRNISPEEADVFHKVGKYAFFTKDNNFVFIWKYKQWLKKEMKTTDMDLSLLRDIGLLSVDNNTRIPMSYLISDKIRTFKGLRMDVICFTQLKQERNCSI